MPSIVPPVVGGASRPSDTGASETCTVSVVPTFTVTEGPAIEKVEPLAAGVVRSVATSRLSESFTVSLEAEALGLSAVSRSPIVAVPGVESVPSPAMPSRSKPSVVPSRSVNARSLPVTSAFFVSPAPPLRDESSEADVSVVRPAVERIDTPAVSVNAAVRSTVAEPRPETSSGRLLGAIDPESKEAVADSVNDSGSRHSIASVVEFQVRPSVAGATPSFVASPEITSSTVSNDQLPLASLSTASTPFTSSSRPSPNSEVSDVSMSGRSKLRPSSGTQRPRSERKAPRSVAVMSASFEKSKAVLPSASLRLGSVSASDDGSKRSLALMVISWAEPTACWRPPRLRANGTRTESPAPAAARLKSEPRSAVAAPSSSPRATTPSLPSWRSIRTRLSSETSRSAGPSRMMPKFASTSCTADAPVAAACATTSKLSNLMKKLCSLASPGARSMPNCIVPEYPTETVAFTSPSFRPSSSSDGVAVVEGAWPRLSV